MGRTTVPSRTSRTSRTSPLPLTPDLPIVLLVGAVVTLFLVFFICYFGERRTCRGEPRNVDNILHNIMLESEFRGRSIVLVYSTHCPACVAVLPAAQALQREHQLTSENLAFAPPDRPRIHLVDVATLSPDNQQRWNIQFVPLLLDFEFGYEHQRTAATSLSAIEACIAKRNTMQATPK